MLHPSQVRLVCSLAHLASHRLKSRQAQAKRLLPRKGKQSMLRLRSPPLLRQAKGLAKRRVQEVSLA